MEHPFSVLYKYLFSSYTVCNSISPKNKKRKAGTVVYVRGVAETGEKDSAIRVSFKVKKTGKTSKCTFASKIKVVSPKPTNVKLTGAVQKEAKKIAVTFDNAAVTPGAVSAFKIIRTEGNVVVPIKAVSYDADKKGATLETYTGMTDAKEYTVTYTDADEAKTESTATFTATDNKIADIQLNTTTVVAKTNSEVKVKTLDAQGVLLNEYSLTQAEANKMTIEVKSANNTGYRSGNSVYVAAVGDVLNVKVTLHTYKYENGVEVDTIERSFDLTGTTEDYAAITYGYTIADSTPSFDAASYKQNTAVAKSNNSANVYFNFKNGSTNKNALFTVESSDNSVAIIAKTQLTSALNYAAIKPVKEGSAYVVVKDASGNLVTTLPFTVGAASKATTITLSTTSITTSDVTGVDKPTTNVVVKDQYDAELTLKNVKVEATDTTTATSAEAITTVKSGTGTKKVVIEVDGTQKPAGKTISYAYKITAETDQGNLTSYLNVTIMHASTDVATSYDLILSTTSVDLAVGKDDDTTTNSYGAVTFKIGKYNKDGALIGYLDIPASKAAITCVSTDNQKSLDVVSGAGFGTDAKTAAVVTKAVSDGAFVAGAGSGLADKIISKKATAGKKYIVTAKFDVAGNITTLVKNFDVQDTQGTFTFEVADTSKDIDATLDNGKKNVTVYRNGDVITGDVDVEAADVVISTGSNGETVKTYRSITYVYNVGGADKSYVYVTATPAGDDPVVITLK